MALSTLGSTLTILFSRGRPIRRSIPDHIKIEADEQDLIDEDLPGSDELEKSRTPNASRLKGIIWPGMHLFDAGTDEMKRRRNQKKDGTALKLMEKTSRIVEPVEVIYDEGGSELKQREITGNVDTSSPLRGEEPLPPPKQPRRKRTALASIDTNITRVPRRQYKMSSPRKSPQRRKIRVASRTGFNNGRSSSLIGSLGVRDRFSPTEDENAEFKLTFGDLNTRKRKGNFAIFDDDESTKPRSRSTMPQPFSAPNLYHRPQLNQNMMNSPFFTGPMSAYPWHQQQYQSGMPSITPSFGGTFNSHLPYRITAGTEPQRDAHQNYSSIDQMMAISGTQNNPLGWHGEQSSHNPFSNRPLSLYNNGPVLSNDYFSLMPNASSLSSTPANPLNMALHQFNGSGHAGTSVSTTNRVKNEGSSTNILKEENVFDLHGAQEQFSDHNSKDYAQSLFGFDH